MNRPHTLPEAKALRIAELYRQGVKIADIMREVGVRPKTVEKYARKAGLAYRVAHSGIRSPSVTPEELERARGLLESGMSYEDVGTIMGVEKSTVFTWRKKLGLPSRRQFRKVPIERYGEIVQMVLDGKTNQDIADAFGVTESTIRKIINGETSDAKRLDIKGQISGYSRHRRSRKLRGDDVELIKSMVESGSRVKLVADMFNVSDTTIHRVVKNET